MTTHGPAPPSGQVDSLTLLNNLLADSRSDTREALATLKASIESHQASTVAHQASTEALTQVVAENTALTKVVSEGVAAFHKAVEAQQGRDRAESLQRTEIALLQSNVALLQRIVYGTVTLVLVAVGAAIIGLVVVKGG